MSNHNKLRTVKIKTLKTKVTKTTSSNNNPTTKEARTTNKTTMAVMELPLLLIQIQQPLLESLLYQLQV